MTNRIGLAAGMAMATLLASMPAAAQDARHPAIAEYGAISPLDNTANRPAPDDDMRVLFEISADGKGPGGANSSLEKVARYLNLLASAGNTPEAGDVKVIIHGPATPLVLADPAYRERFGSANPNTGMIAALQGAGVDIHVCGQALAGNDIVPDAVNPAVTVDLSAITTLVLLQRQGWPVISD
ncbi:DsrE family protein [Pacificimonas flava]|uniref:Uncharacterized protein n=1 Tax=Pacificimonas flava TaxID=1234595 RepID=M2S911_9SPHN|nr:DsrE family protein [Pacificimonas flava]EMD81835.1 hypothetical protein C725_2817 [Pacificimonas flava]MBB5281635.1 intracellular sulfur oxidation DsrE/DsrF family protein [Pacificimonas flava]